MYHLVKIAFLIWCFLPSTRGALILYHKIVEPILVKYESRIDNLETKGSAIASRVGGDIMQEAEKEISLRERKIVDNAVNNLLHSGKSQAAPVEEPKKTE